MTNLNQILSLVRQNQGLADFSPRTFPEKTWVQGEEIGDDQKNNSFLPPIALGTLLVKSKTLEEDLLSYLRGELNKIHHEELSEKAWQIIIGHWVRGYSRLITKYSLLIQKAISEKDFAFSEVHLRVITDKLNVPYDTEEAIKSFEKFDLIERICATIYNELADPYVKVVYFSKDQNKEKSPPKRLPYKAKISEKIISKIEFMCSRYAEVLSRNNDAIIVSTYLPFRYEFILNLKLMQFPRFRMISRIGIKKKTNPEIRLRNELLRFTTFDSLEMKVAKLLLSESMPLVFLEEFHEVNRSIEFHRLPTHPRFIFTSNNFMTDEVFKQYTARQVDRNVPYFVGQHGNNYGSLLEANPTIEEQTSNTFLSWGWKSEKAVPMFILKNPKPRKRRKSNHLSNLLFITSHRNAITSLHDVQKELDQNLIIQECFLETIYEEIKDVTLIRMHPNALLTGEKNVSVNSSARGMKIDYGNCDIKELEKNSRIVLHAYDSTGILETLSANIPTLALWDVNSSIKTDDAQPLYNLLNAVGIFHYSGQSAGNFLNSIWNDIDSWWQGDGVQFARRLFCEQFARTTKTPVGELLSVLRSESRK